MDIAEAHIPCRAVVCSVTAQDLFVQNHRLKFAFVLAIRDDNDLTLIEVFLDLIVEEQAIERAPYRFLSLAMIEAEYICGVRFADPTWENMCGSYIFCSTLLFPDRAPAPRACRVVIAWPIIYFAKTRREASVSVPIGRLLPSQALDSC